MANRAEAVRRRLIELFSWATTVDKLTLRQQLLQQRLDIANERMQEWSDIIQYHVLKSPFWPERGRVGLYSPMKNEVHTYRLFQLALEQGLHVYFPRVEQGLKFYEVNGPEDLQRGAWAIPEPHDPCPMLPQDEKLDLLIVPGIVFTKDCHRVGYGRGFYDRVVGIVSERCVGLGYHFQVVNTAPLDEWDKPLNAVVTEQQIFRRT